MKLKLEEKGLNIDFLVSFYTKHIGRDVFVMPEMTSGKLLWVFWHDLHFSRCYEVSNRNNPAKHLMINFDQKSNRNIPNAHLLKRFCVMDECKVILRRFESITDDEMETLLSLRFSFEDFDIKTATARQIEYLNEIGIDVPLWLGFNHPLNNKTAVELGLGIYK